MIEYADKCGLGNNSEQFRHNPSYVPHIITIVGVEAICLGFRLASKVYRLTSWGPDDFFIVGAYVRSNPRERWTALEANSPTYSL
ncbi:hypothetical protein CTA1_13 [Colletotrichum tanaceti]|uniref:Uncharacterized protein n=1 Tax=Colletotrichum tanaceti TaxID=1306861 RepID=A0A4V6DH81_9PEZI|nr:hypothetical protein CTA1_13 [Colletotrichum tanaceti]